MGSWGGRDVVLRVFLGFVARCFGVDFLADWGAVWDD